MWAFLSFVSSSITMHDITDDAQVNLCCDTRGGGKFLPLTYTSFFRKHFSNSSSIF